jgi:hypothetical protein
MDKEYSMEAPVDELMEKVRAIVASPKGDLLRQIVDFMYESVEGEYDSEPLTQEDLEAIERGREDIKQGRYITLEEFERKFGL